MKQIKLIIACALLISLTANVSAQGRNSAITGQTKNYISTGMPILLIASDAISGAMGDVGAATTPDMYSGHWNNAKFAFIDSKFGVSTTYTPWLRNIGVGDMNLLYLSLYKKINARSTFAASVTYFSLGDIDGTDEQGNLTLTMHPNEFATDATYAMKLSDELSIAATGRFIRSDLTNGQDISDGSSRSTTKPANSFAADLGMYWQHDLEGNQQVAIGGFISNLGAKLSYSDDDTHKEFLPTNLRLGARYTTDIDSYNDISFMFDVNKLLVPTPPVTVGDETYSDYYANRTEYANTGVIRGALQSFYDAPGGITEELHELQLSAGAEYWYKKTLAVRAGYFYEHDTKGGRQYATVGFGVRYNLMQFDFAYLIPTTRFRNNPLSNTVRITLSLKF